MMNIPLFEKQIEKTTAEWNSENNVLGEDVIGIEVMSNGFNRFKRGNGTDSWSRLPYLDKIPPMNITAAMLDAYTKSETDNLLSDKFGSADVIPVANGGTGATTAAGALTNLGAANKSHTHSYLPLSGGTLTGNLTIPNGTSILIKNSSDNTVSALIIDSSNNLILGNGTGNTVNAVVKGKTVKLQSSNGEIALAPSGTAYSFIAESISGSNVGPAFHCSTQYYGTLGTTNFLWNKVYAVNGVSTSSDARLKKNVSSDLSALMDVMAEIEPVSFEYSDLDDGKMRFGFIAQDVESTLKKHGMDPDKMALLQKDTISKDSKVAKNISDTTVYFLNYSEFIALNTKMIQDLMRRVSDLESKIGQPEGESENENGK